MPWVVDLLSRVFVTRLDARLLAHELGWSDLYQFDVPEIWILLPDSVSDTRHDSTRLNIGQVHLHQCQWLINASCGKVLLHAEIWKIKSSFHQNFVRGQELVLTIDAETLFRRRKVVNLKQLFSWKLCNFLLWGDNFNWSLKQLQSWVLKAMNGFVFPKILRISRF